MSDTTATLTPAQQEVRAYEDTSQVLAIREEQFAAAPSYIPQAGEWAALKEMARSLCVTEFVPKEMRGRPFAVLGAMLTARDLRLPIMLATRRIFVVNGRPSLETAVKVALVRNRGHKVRVLDWTSERCTVSGWRRGDPIDEVMEVTYTIDDAKVAGDYDKPGDTYKKRPRQMLYARAAGLLCDTYFSDITLGMPDPDDAVELPSEVIEGSLAERDRRGDLPVMYEPPTAAEQAARDREREEESRRRLAEASTPPPAPRTRGRGKGASPNPQQGSDGGAPAQGAVGGPGPDAQPVAEDGRATQASAPPATPALVSDAQIARDLGLDEEADALERGELVPSPAMDLIDEARGRIEPRTAAGPAAVRQAIAETRAQHGDLPPETDPFASPARSAPKPAVSPPSEPPGPEDISELVKLRQQAETYADFLARRKLERDGRPAQSLEAIHADAMTRLGQLSKAMLGCDYDRVSEAQLKDTLLPWLRGKYASEGGR